MCKMDLANGSNDEGQRFIKDIHLYISNGKEHDILFVQHCLLQHWNWFTNQGMTPHVIWSDKCVSQFKDSKVMYFVAHYLGLTRVAK